MKDINRLINETGKIKSINENEKKALLINLYNLSAIKQIAENYPINSPQEITKFYDVKYIPYNNSTLSLNDIENDIIRKDYKDPRVHFVLVCRALGCPPIVNYAYTPDKIDGQLDLQTKSALNNTDFIKVDDNYKIVFVSEIFKWYDEDFKKSNKSVIHFINKYRNSPIDENYKLDYYPYNWKINDFKTVIGNNILIDEPSENVKTKKSTQDYTPSVLYKKGQWEYKFFNNLYSQTKGYNINGNKVKYSSRGSYFSSVNQILIGVNSRLNLGVDFWVKSVRIDDTASSPFKLLSFENSPNTRTTLTNMGPKIKFQPIKKLIHLSVQSTFLFPIAKDQEGKLNGKPYLSADSYILITQIFYDQAIGKKLQLFFQLAPWIYIKQKPITNRYSVSSPADIFLSFFPSKRLTIYFQEEFWPNYGSKGIDSWFRQEGIGAKFQIIKGKLEMEISHTRFSMGKSVGAGATYNFGLRFIHL
ncbi:MAG: DUF547 domain-containing protein [Bacteroidetes bacterium]|nr:DUF547 domain-containing protein [Bacteroidota bacterium]